MVPGTDAVIMVEQVPDPEADPITVEAPTFPWQHVRRVGEDLVTGEMVLPEGVEITPWAQGALLAAGVTRIKVRRRPRVAIIPTGAELVPVTELDRDLPEGRLPEFNSTILSGLVAAAGGVAEVLPIVPDDPEGLAAALKDSRRRRRPGADQRRVFRRHRGLHLPGHRLPGRSAGPRGRHDAGQTHGVGGRERQAGHRQPGLPRVRGALLRAVRRPPHHWPGGETPGPPAHPDSASGPEPALQARPDGIHPGNLRKGRGQGHRHTAAPGSRDHHLPGAGRRAAGGAGLERRPGGGPAGGRGTAGGSPADIDGTLVVLGSHDNTIDLLATLLRRRDHRLRLSSGHVGSLGGLMALRQGRAHLGGSHMLDPETNTYNVPFIERYLPGVPLKLVNLAWREQGLMVAPGNPQQITAIRDLTRPGVRFINRQRGAGTRLLLDYLLQEAGLKADQVQGYEREEYTHMAVAVNVFSGTADVGLGILAAAKALGLDFIPLLPERYDLVVPETTFADPRFQTLLAVVRSREFQAAAAALGGYDLKDCGRVLWEQ